MEICVCCCIIFCRSDGIDVRSTVVRDSALSVVVGCSCGIGTSQSPSEKLRYPVRIILLFFEAVNWDFERWTSHPSSHNCPRDSNGVFNSLKTCASLAIEDRSVVKGRIPVDVEVMVELSARWTVVGLLCSVWSRTFL